MRRLALVLLAALIPAIVPAQGFQLTVENIMRGADLVGTAPANVRFSADGRYVYFRWRSPGADTADQDYRAAVAGGSPERLARFAVDTIPMADGTWSPDRTREVVVLKGDLWLVDRRGAKRRLSETAAAESNPDWSGDGRTVFFTRDGNAWALDVDGGAERQLTDVRRGPAPKAPTEPTGEKRFLRDQQRELFDFIRRQVAEQRQRADSDTTGRKAVWLPETESVVRFETSPDGRFVLATVSDRPDGTAAAQQVTMPLWVTQTGFVETQQIRTKVGDAQNHQRAVVIDVATGKATWIQRDTLKDSAGSGTRETDNVAIGFSPNSRHALVRMSSRDFKDAWLMVVDLPSLARRDVVHLHDDAWLGVDGFLGPGAWSGWLGDGETVYYASEETGYAHLYVVPAAGGAPRALTSGDWEVQSVALSPDKRSFFLETNEGDWGQVHLYALPATGGPRTRITGAEGRQDAVVAPDAATLAVLQSTANHPPELYVQSNRPGAAPRQITASTTPEWRGFNWIKPEIVAIPASDGVQVPARLYRPTGTANHAAVIFVHGAGYLQNVHKWWSSYYREYMFNQLLAARGYTVLDLDYRGSAGHGRAWRTAIYRHMGGRDLDDQVDAARWLVRQMAVDSTRIGIYGGSYGGFITLMALFTKPGVFAAGAALRPVTDWAHYNHGYTARILNQPQDDSVAYRQSSPIYFAQGLKGRLLLCHGLVDDNVHFQDTARLIQRLIELGKQNWDVAVYPVEAHGFRRNDSWTDEYRRILRLFEETIGN